jgi:hypothetical protein
LARSPELLGNLEVGLALGFAGASGGKNRNEPFEFSPRLEHEKLFFDLDFGDPESVAAQWNNEMI